MRSHVVLPHHTHPIALHLPEHVHRYPEGGIGCERRVWDAYQKAKKFIGNATMKQIMALTRVLIAYGEEAEAHAQICGGWSRRVARDVVIAAHTWGAP